MAQWGTINADASLLPVTGLPPPPRSRSIRVLRARWCSQWWAQVLRSPTIRVTLTTLPARPPRPSSATAGRGRRHQVRRQRANLRADRADCHHDSGIGGQLPQMFSGLGQGLLGTAVRPVAADTTAQGGQLVNQLAGQFAQLGQSGATTPTERGGLDGTGGLTDESWPMRSPTRLGGDLGDGLGDSSGGGSAALPGPRRRDPRRPPRPPRNGPFRWCPAWPRKPAPVGRRGIRAMPMMPGARWPSAPGGRDGPSDGTPPVSVPHGPPVAPRSRADQRSARPPRRSQTGRRQGRRDPSHRHSRGGRRTRLKGGRMADDRPPDQCPAECREITRVWLPWTREVFDAVAAHRHSCWMRCCRR